MATYKQFEDLSSPILGDRRDFVFRKAFLIKTPVRNIFRAGLLDRSGARALFNVEWVVGVLGDPLDRGFWCRDRIYRTGTLWTFDDPDIREKFNDAFLKTIIPHLEQLDDFEEY